MAKFRGYFVTNESFTDVSNFPLEHDEDDSVIGVWQSTNNQTRKSMIFEYKIVNDVGSWVAKEGTLYTRSSVEPTFTPFEGRSLNVYEPYGMGLYSMIYAYVDIGALASWGPSVKVGNDEVAAYDLEFHDVFTGNITTELPDTIGLLPTYIRSGEQIVGIGSATLVGAWRVMWYKMAAIQGGPPSIVTDTETALTDKRLQIKGNTLSFILTVCDKDGNTQIITGIYSDPITTYSLDAYPDRDWLWLTLEDQNGNLVYKMTNDIYPAFIEISVDWSIFQNTYNRALKTKIPKDIVDEESGFLSSVGLTTTNDGKLMLCQGLVNLETGEETSPTVEFPTATITDNGVMSKEDKALFVQALLDIADLLAAGGSWIGVNYPTAAALPAPPLTGINDKDYTYVLDDENHGHVRTIYVATGNPLAFIFSREDSQAAPEIATGTGAGLVKSSTAPGKVVVDEFGVMSVNGFSGLADRITTLEQAMENKEEKYIAPLTDPMYGLTLSQALAYLNNVVNGITGVKINHIV